MKKIKLVVFNSHTLGYILPELPNTLCVLASSILRGAPFDLLPSGKYINESDNIKIASVADFDAFNVSFEGYNDSDVYEFSPCC